MSISVALATYNGSAFIAEQLASIAGQTRRPDEVVVSDDGSNDDTLDIVRSFAEAAPFPVVIAAKSQRLGFADNFLHAASRCRHERIAFCDQDDVWLPRKLELGAARIEADNSLLSMHRLTVTDETLRPTGFEWDQGIDADRVLESLTLDPFATGWGNTMMFRRELLDGFLRDQRPRQPFEHDRPLSHDTWIYVLAAALGRVSWIAKPLILYRQHGNAATVATEPSRGRPLQTALAVPLREFGERISFYRAMAHVFRQMEAQDGRWAAPSSAAARVYAERAKRWSARRDIFDGASLLTRCRAFRSFHELNRAKAHSIRSRTKDIVLGVSGIARAAVPRSSRR